MCPGVCKDRLADAFERFGRVEIEKRRIRVPSDHPILRRDEEPFWSAGGWFTAGKVASFSFVIPRNLVGTMLG
ncbi:MAG TPA: hypothetical protein VJP06_05280 [Thermoplasmata archaeon]|nr:hypothetical protein [Thermoplasmata archaeon]